ncbi:MAG: DUF3098 domain-containing protein [Bacteroidales bacterium]|jgi:membrane-bound ClpP family serine protease|nr:DUF3098 domain-containing protein [Bacteroidales bacterium]MBQ1753939.1 DUF3098 domain-containing protein [Bacteroidales bacterium]MBQ1831954.1 DUF3098 domain-containing protein [Bacteroidales bacterium]MBQ2149498.1 DUF3098 domain-containing protein [Bacteroidales bacterium]MBQ2194897.1 DUF3098 domain-containing protein [Bacteroidales bacterium]
MANFSLPSKNVKIIAIGLVVMILGFILMIGGGSSDPNVFNPAMFSFRRLTLAPIVIIAGIVVVLFGIMKTPKEKKEE